MNAYTASTLAAALVAVRKAEAAVSEAIVLYARSAAPADVLDRLLDVQSEAITTRVRIERALELESMTESKEAAE